MSTVSGQQEVQSEEQSWSAVFMTTIIRNFLLNPIPEVSTPILCNFTLEQLIAFRCICKGLNSFVLLHQSVIVQGVLENAVYGSTATTLYHDLLPPSPRTFKDLIGISRRCWMARKIAHLLAQCRTMSRGPLLYNMSRFRDEQSFNTAKLANYAYPYILVLIQFFEEYRYRLASLVVDPNEIQNYSDQVEELLLAKHNEKTVHRLCALYHVLLDLLRFTISETQHLSMITLLGIARTNYPSSALNAGEHIDFFTFGGLEIFADVIRLPYHALDIVMAHYSRVTPIQLPVTYDGQSRSAFLPLCRSILSPVNEINNVTAPKICTLLPNGAIWRGGWIRSSSWSRKPHPKVCTEARINLFGRTNAVGRSEDYYWRFGDAEEEEEGEEEEEEEEPALLR